MYLRFAPSDTPHTIFWLCGAVVAPRLGPTETIFGATHLVKGGHLVFRFTVPREKSLSCFTKHPRFRLSRCRSTGEKHRRLVSRQAPHTEYPDIHPAYSVS